MYYEKNTRLLKTLPFQQALLETLDKSQPCSQVSLMETAAGDHTLIVSLPDTGYPCFLHAPSGAEQEALACAKAQCHPDKGNLHILFGLGLGYLLEAVFEQSEGHIIIYEPDLGLLRFILENADLSRFFESERVFLATTTHQLIDVMPAFFCLGGEVNAITLPGETQRLGEEVPRLLSLIQHRVGDFTNSVKVGFIYNLQWYQQFFKNLPHWPGCTPFTPLLDQFEKVPALLVSSGPSLDDNLEAIRAVSGRYLVFAVAGALRPLLRAGITPDFAVFLDYEGHRQQLHGIAPHETRNVHFILGPYADSVAFEYEAASRFWVPLSNYPNFSEWLETSLLPELLPSPRVGEGGATAPGEGYKKLRIQSGSSCSLMALHCAIAMGCGPLVVIGQDLAFRGNQQYATGGQKTTTAQLAFNESTQEFELPDSSEFYGRKIHWTTVKGQNGEPLRTAPDYKIFLRQLGEFSRMNAALKNPKRLYNASIGGAFIEGFEHADLKTITQREDLPLLHKTSLITSPYRERSLKFQRNEAGEGEPRESQMSLNSPSPGHPLRGDDRPLPAGRGDMKDGSVQRLQLFLSAVRSCVQSGQFAIHQLDTFLEGVKTGATVHELQQSLPLVETSRNALVTKLRADPFIASALNGEIWFWQDRVKEQEEKLNHQDTQPVSDDALYEDLRVERTYLHRIVTILQESLHPWGQTALDGLQSGYKIPTRPVQAVSTALSV